MRSTINAWKKRIGAVAAAGFFAFGTAAAPSWADQDGAGLSAEPVRVESIGMEMQVPEGWVTLTQEMAEDDPVFTENHMDGASMIKNYQENGILIDSLNMENRVEFNVALSGKDENIIQLTQFSDEDVRIYAEGLTTPDTDNGLSFHDYEIYDHDQLRFIAGEAEIKSNGETMGTGQQYYTIVNGNRLCFQMVSFDGELSQEDRQMFRSMIDSVHFDSLQEAGALSIKEGTNPILEQFSAQYFLRNLIILLAAILIGYYGIGKIRKK